MSMFENGRYCWRETYFVLFESSKRPTLEEVQRAMAAVNSRFTLTNLRSDEQGRAESFTVLAPDDFAALDISYLEGDEVLEQSESLAKDLESGPCRVEDRDKPDKIRRSTGRFDVLHFEQVVDFGDDQGNEMLDPTALLVVLETLVRLTSGIAIDPQTGTAL